MEDERGDTKTYKLHGRVIKQRDQIPQDIARGRLKQEGALTDGELSRGQQALYTSKNNPKKRKEKEDGESGLTYLGLRPNRPYPSIFSVLLPFILMLSSELCEARPCLSRRRHELSRVLG